MKQIRKTLGAIGASAVLFCAANAVQAADYSGSLNFSSAPLTSVDYLYDGAVYNGLAGISIQRFDLGTGLGGPVDASITLGNLSSLATSMGVFFATDANASLMSNPTPLAGLLTLTDSAAQTSFMNANVAGWDYLLWGNRLSYNATTDIDAQFSSMSFLPDTQYYGFVFGGSLALDNVNVVDPSAAFALSIAAVPEPEMWMSMLAGLGLMGIISRRRTRMPA